MKIEPEEESFDPTAWKSGDEQKRLGEGIRLFNQGQYYAAHEAFEQAWLSTQGPNSDFFKGLIQAAICLHHLADGNLDGARGLYGGHRRYLAGYLPSHLGVAVRELLGDMQLFVRPALAQDDFRFEPSAAPRIQSSSPT